MTGLCVWAGLLVSQVASAAATDPAPPPAARVVPRAQIDGPSAVVAPRAIRLDGRQAISTLPLRWMALERDTPLLVFDQQGRKHTMAMVLDPDPGTYHFAQIAVGTDNDGDGMPDVSVAVKVVTVTAPGPGPAPPPGPDPTPDPTPTPPPSPDPTPTPGPGPVGPPPVPTPVPAPLPARGPLHVSLVTDRNRMTPALAKVMADATLGPALAKVDARWHEYDLNSDEVARYAMRPLIDRAGTPPAMLIVQDSSGHVAGVKVDVVSAAGVLGFVKSLRGLGPGDAPVLGR